MHKTACNFEQNIALGQPRCFAHIWINYEDPAHIENLANLWETRRGCTNTDSALRKENFAKSDNFLFSSFNHNSEV